MSRQGKKADIRRLITHSAARMLANQECLDIQTARRKAAARLGVRDRQQLPDNLEISQAVREYQATFFNDTQPATLRLLRTVAVDAMRNLDCFNPHLTGPVLNGSANDLSPVKLYLYTETPEEVILYLLDKKIPFEERDIRLIYPRGASKTIPTCSFRAGSTVIQLVLLPLGDRANPPLDPLSDRPEKGAGINRVMELLK
ncbi:MAG: hypothetical protein GY703_24870 [Gammaproteobacteria bacterium]|nr:hypothetical protein [Gammaproteobacteria bacterium]